MIYQIKTKKVNRYFAPKVASTGKIVSKGFTTRAAAARAIAREFLLDSIFGEKTGRCDLYDGYYWARDWDLEKMKFIFDCNECEAGDYARHNHNGYREAHLCTDSGKQFCAAAWMCEVRRIAKLILKNEPLKVSPWILERASEYAPQQANEEVSE